METRAGPPKCPDCDRVMEAWTRKYKPFNGVMGLLWICPDFCNMKSSIKCAELRSEKE